MTDTQGDPQSGRVRLFHASLVWPLHLEPIAASGSEGRYWEVFESRTEASYWRRIDDEFMEDPGQFKELLATIDPAAMTPCLGTIGMQLMPLLRELDKNFRFGLPIEEMHKRLWDRARAERMVT